MRRSRRIFYGDVLKLLASKVVMRRPSRFHITQLRTIPDAVPTAMPVR